MACPTLTHALMVPALSVTRPTRQLTPVCHALFVDCLQASLKADQAKLADLQKQEAQLDASTEQVTQQVEQLAAKMDELKKQVRQTIGVQLDGHACSVPILKECFNSEAPSVPNCWITI